MQNVILPATSSRTNPGRDEPDSARIVIVPVGDAGFTQAETVKLARVSIAWLVVATVVAAETVPSNSSTGIDLPDFAESAPIMLAPAFKPFPPEVPVTVDVFASGIEDGNGAVIELIGQLWNAQISPGAECANTAGDPSLL